jgi:hypothetical protein
MWAIQLVPSWRREVSKGSRAQGMTRYQYQPGLAFVEHMGGGLLLPQVYAFGFRSRKIHFTDDLIFAPAKQGLFQLLILPTGTDEIEQLTTGLEAVEEASRGLLFADEATVLVQSTKASMLPLDIKIPQEVARIATGDEFAEHETLCKGRPLPVGYDELRMSKEVQQQKYVVVRPDMFVFAACNNVVELEQAVSRLPGALHFY